MTYKCVEFGDREFSSRDDMFSALLKNKNELIKLKKAKIQKSKEKGQISNLCIIKPDSSVKSFNMDENKFYPIINTTNYIDSHNDVHFPGLWSKTINEQKGNVFYVLDHKLEIDKVVAWPNDVDVFTSVVPWSMVGKDYAGFTEALIYGINKDAISNDLAKQIIEEKRPVQNSIRMGYVKIKLAADDNRIEFKEHKEYFDARINDIANKDVAMNQGFFWGIEEAKIIKEGSMVLFGSNDATPIQYSEAGDTSEKQDPSNDSLKNKTIYSLFI